jgi:hypothetical protein
MLVSLQLKGRSNVRLKPNNIAQQLPLIPLLVAHFPRPVDHIDARHPFVYRQLVLAREIVDVSDQAAHYLAHARGGFGARGFDDMLGEVGIESGVVLDAVAVCACHVEGEM